MTRPGRGARTSTLILGFVLALVAAVAPVATVLLVPAGTVHAHNSLVSTTPADGAVLDSAPSEVSFLFDKAVPLDSATVTLVDATGVRTELPIAHGPSGENEVVASLAGVGGVAGAAALIGEITVRWRLVGDDGHVVSGRVNLTITGAGTDADAAGTVPTTAVTPPTTAPGSESGGTGAGASTDADSDEPGSSALGWIARFGSYLAILAVLAVVLVDLLIVPGLAAGPLGRRTLHLGLIGVAGFGLVQLAVVAADLTGRSVISALGELRPAFDSANGQAITIRILLAGVGAVLVAPLVGRARAAQRATTGQLTALAILGLAMMGTWAWVGHSRTERWPWLGVPVDIVHHSAAALWIGGLAVVGALVLGGRAAGDGQPGAVPVVPGLPAVDAAPGAPLVPVVQRFSTTAMAAVIAIAATGAVQTVRLHDDLGALPSSQHGRLIAVKVVLFAAMLAVAAGNRRRVAHLTGRTAAAAADAGGGLGDDAQTAVLAGLRRSMLIDLAVGIAVIAVTTSLVTSLI